MKFFKILKKLFLYSSVIFVVGCLSIYIYIENGAKIYFPEKQRIEIIKNIKSAPQQPDNFVQFYNSVYPESLKDNFWKIVYRNFTTLFPVRNILLSRNVANNFVSPFSINKGHNRINNISLIRYIEQNTTQKECLNFEFQKFDFLHNRKGIDAVSQDLFKKSVNDLQPIEMAEILALYENPDGIILNVKKININANDKEAIVALSKIDDTYFFTAQAEKEQSVVNILSYNDKILTISQTRNGCSLSIGGAGIIWGTAFGALSMGAGAAASLVFLLMAEALC